MVFLKQIIYVMFFDKKILVKSDHLHPSIYKGWGKNLILEL